MRKYITFKEFYALDVQNPDQKQEAITGSNALIDTVSAFHPCTAMFNIETNDNAEKPLYVHYAIYLTHPELTLRISYDNNRKKWSIYNMDIAALKNVTYFTQEEVRKGLTEPRAMGKLSANKILEWINYLEEEYRQLVLLNSANKDAIQAFLDSIKDLPVRWFDNNRQGSIVRNGIELAFRIHETYVSQKISIHYTTSNTVSDFVRLSDNKWTAPKIVAGK